MAFTELKLEKRDVLQNFKFGFGSLFADKLVCDDNHFLASVIPVSAA